MFNILDVLKNGNSKMRNWTAIEASNPVPYNNPGCRLLFLMS